MKEMTAMTDTGLEMHKAETSTGMVHWASDCRPSWTFCGKRVYRPVGLDREVGCQKCMKEKAILS